MGEISGLIAKGSAALRGFVPLCDLTSCLCRCFSEEMAKERAMLRLELRHPEGGLEEMQVPLAKVLFRRF